MNDIICSKKSIYVEIHNILFQNLNSEMRKKVKFIVCSYNPIHKNAPNWRASFIVVSFTRFTSATTCSTL